MPAILFDPSSDEPFVLSRSRVDNFLECSRCFYLTNRVGIARPPSFPFNLNNAVDELLKNEFDIYDAIDELLDSFKSKIITEKDFHSNSLETITDFFKDKERSLSLQ